MRNSQLLKGVLDGCVLKTISRQEIYGYDLIKELQDMGFNDIKGGTVYPLLQKLEKNKLIDGKTKPSPDGPNRKYFTITEDGKNELKEFKTQWNDLVGVVEQIMEDA
ncbi:PadR family transcriptional regulator [Carnobacteriaceae bacterium 52-44]|jgi:PadR family transcriptional regulator PadR